MSDCFKLVISVVILTTLWSWVGCYGGEPAEPLWSTVVELRDGGSD